MIFPIPLSRQSDEQLMQRAADDNQRAFTELYNRYAWRLQGFLLRQLGGDRELAADFTHDVFLRLYDARRQYHPGRSFQTWLFTVAYNLCKNRYRHQQVEAEAMALLDQQPEATMPDIEVRMDREQLGHALSQVLGTLPADARMLFALRFEEELTTAQTAAVMQLPEGTVKSRQHKIMNLIKQRLKGYETH